MDDRSRDKKFRMLELIYRFYDDIAWSLNSWECRPGCSECCTSLVILTTLEAAYLWNRYPSLLNESAGAFGRVSTPPLMMTSNELASLCIARTDFQECSQPPSALPCPLLEDRRCLCYEARPLMCRLMLSSVRCEETGQAEIPSRLLSLNTVLMQMVEHLDQNGWSGYLSHLIPLFQKSDFLKAYKGEAAGHEEGRVRRNQPNPGLIVPQEDKDQVQTWLTDLRRRLQAL